MSDRDREDAYPTPTPTPRPSTDAIPGRTVARAGGSTVRAGRAALAEPGGPERRVLAAADLDARFRELRREATTGLAAPPVTVVVRRAVHRRRRRRVVASAGMGVLVLAVGWAAPQLAGLSRPALAGGPQPQPQLSAIATAAPTATVYGRPDELSPTDLAAASDLSWGGGDLPVAVSQLPVVPNVYGPWASVKAADGTPAAPALASDQPACLAGSVADLRALSVSGQDYREVAGPSGDPSAAPGAAAVPGAPRAYQYVLNFATPVDAVQAGKVLAGTFGCKGGHGGLTKVGGMNEVTVLRDDYRDASAQPVSSVEEFSVVVRGVRVAVLGVQRTYRPGQPDYLQATEVHAEFRGCTELLGYRLGGG